MTEEQKVDIDNNRIDAIGSISFSAIRAETTKRKVKILWKCFSIYSLAINENCSQIRSLKSCRMPQNGDWRWSSRGKLVYGRKGIFFLIVHVIFMIKMPIGTLRLCLTQRFSLLSSTYALKQIFPLGAISRKIENAKGKQQQQQK